MKLIRYLVTNFKSVEDSGWIEADNVTALIGVNESGKTNLLLPLWKLNPAREGEIQPTSDYPKTKFGEVRDNPGDFCFITADFQTGSLVGKLAELTGLPEDALKTVQVKRYFDGEYQVSFPLYKQENSLSTEFVSSLLKECSDQISDLAPLKQEEALKGKLLEAISEELDRLKDQKDISVEILAKLISHHKSLIPSSPARSSLIVPRYVQALDALQERFDALEAPSPEEVDGVLNAVVKALPKFVYYSNYGNLDSEIYLPHVVQNLSRTDLGAKEAAKARTLRVLFKFVRLKPEEILELGRDFKDPNREPTSSEITAIAEKKRERTILLQAADTTLTKRFREWWRQGDYRFEFQADGNHFRIWVSDDRRPEKIELESRSTGLQWFLSFYLIFLVESEGEHQNAILLLDEPGLSLHPLAQRQLSAFFDGLSETNQILYTTHSPFLVDADRLDRARKVYVSENGTSKATPDLRFGSGDARQQGAAYAVYSALNLSIAESLLLGCIPIIVEGASDQHYLTAIKALLIGSEKIAPKRELVFPPSGGSKTAKVVAAILTGRDEKLPVVLLDSDEPGKRMAKELKGGIYATEKDKVLDLQSYVGFDLAEIEDLFPVKFLGRIVDRWLKDADTPFEDVVKAGQPIVGQIEDWAKSQNISLPDHWKVELSKRAKQSALTKGIEEFDEATIDLWTRLFAELIAKS